MDLASVLNAPTEFTLDGETFRLRKPTLTEEAEYQVWLEQLAFDAINRRTYQSDQEKALSIRMHDQDCAAGAYDFRGELSVRRLMTAKGLAKLLSIICRDQKLTESKAERLVELESRKIAAVLVSKATTDPKVLEAVRVTLGLPEGFFSSSSPTPRSTTASTTSAP